MEFRAETRRRRELVPGAKRPPISGVTASWFVGNRNAAGATDQPVCVSASLREQILSASGRYAAIPARFAPGRLSPYLIPARGPGGRVALRRTEESPGSTGTRCRVTPGGSGFGRGQGKCHREQTAHHLRVRARVKGCGKSAPRDRQRKRHGKPHREQDRIGAAYGEFRPVARVDCLSPHASAGLEEWPPIARTSLRGKGRVDRTRLTGPLALSLRVMTG